MSMFKKIIEDTSELDMYEKKALNALLTNIRITEEGCWIDESRDCYILKRGSNYHQMNAIQIAFRLSYFESLTGKQVYHCCSTRNCCNPEHVVSIGSKTDMSFMEQYELTANDWLMIRYHMEHLNKSYHQLRIKRYNHLILKDAVETYTKAHHGNTNPTKLNNFLIKYKLVVQYAETSEAFRIKLNQLAELYEYTPYMTFNDYCIEIIKLNCFLYNEIKFLNHCTTNWAEFKNVVD